MPKRTHADYPGAWWHITNRGIAKRAVFENGQDFEFFLALLGVMVERGLIEVHAYSLLSTHVHLLIRSVAGKLGDVMQWLFLQYVRYFNRSRKRDGSLFRGRYKARLIEDSCYWENTLRYIDRNPVEAGMCARAEDYPFGSAAAYRSGGGPIWLTRDAVEAATQCHTGRSTFTRYDFDRFVAGTPPDVVAVLVEGRLGRSRSTRSLPVYDLIRSASLRQQRWFAWKAELADGTRVGQPIVPCAHVTRLMSRLRARSEFSQDETEAKRLRTALSALLREVSGLTYGQVAEAMGIAQTTAFSHVRRHARLAESDAPYRGCFAQLVDSVVRRAYPGSAIKTFNWPPL